jgi:hypothetical protein
MSVAERDNRVGGRDVDVVGSKLNALTDLHDRHGSPTRQNLPEHAFSIGGQVQYQHKGHTRIGDHMIEKAMESLDAPSGRTNRDDRKLAGTHLAFQQCEAANIGI